MGNYDLHWLLVLEHVPAVLSWVVHDVVVPLFLQGQIVIVVSGAGAGAAAASSSLLGRYPHQVVGVLTLLLSPCIFLLRAQRRVDQLDLDFRKVHVGANCQ